MSQQDIVDNDNDNTYPSQIPLKVFPEFCCLGVKSRRFSWLLLQGPQRRADRYLAVICAPRGIGSGLNAAAKPAGVKSAASMRPAHLGVDPGCVATIATQHLDRDASTLLSVQFSYTRSGLAQIPF